MQLFIVMINCINGHIVMLFARNILFVAQRLGIIVRLSASLKVIAQLVAIIYIWALRLHGVMVN